MFFFSVRNNISAARFFDAMKDKQRKLFNETFIKDNQIIYFVQFFLVFISKTYLNFELK